MKGPIAIIIPTQRDLLLAKSASDANRAKALVV